LPTGPDDALARIQPQLILLLGLTPSERTYLAALLPQRKILDINSLDDFASKFPEVVARRESIVCSASQIIAGLLLAEFSGTWASQDRGAKLNSCRQGNRSTLGTG
jgi:hypothetical protein